MKNLKRITFLPIMLFASILVFDGCKKDEPNSEVILHNNTNSFIYYLEGGECTFPIFSTIGWPNVSGNQSVTLTGKKGSSKIFCLDVRYSNSWENLTITFPSEGGESKTVNMASSSGGLGKSPHPSNDCSDPDDCPVAVHYQNRIGGIPGCQPCANCAILACYICIAADQATIDAQIATVKQEAAALGGNPTCPELY